MRASFRSLGRTGQTWNNPSSMVLSLSPFFGFVTPSPPCHSIFPTLSFVRHPRRWLEEREVCRQRQDTPFVSQRRTCLAELRFQPRCQTKSHLVQELQDTLLVCLPSKSAPPPSVIMLAVLSPSLYLTPSSLSFFDGRSRLKDKKKPSNNMAPSTPNKLLSRVFRFHLPAPSES